MLRSLRLAGRSAVALSTVGAGAYAFCAPAPESLASQRPPTIVKSAVPSPPITLEYFALRGLGELARMLLEVSGVPYDCVFHYGSGAHKEYTNTFGQLPVLRDGDLVVVESGAICRHIARRACMDGTTLAEKAQVDMYYELTQDMNKKTAAIFDLEGHADAPSLKTFLSYAEAACNGKYFVGSSTTLADVAMFKQLHFFEEVAPGSLSAYPKLKAFVDDFAQLPAVAAYLKSDKRMPLTPNEVGDKPHAGMPGYVFLSKPPAGSYAENWEGLKK